MSNNRVGRRIKHRHHDELLQQRVAEVLALAERDGCDCDPCVIPPWETENGHWQLLHNHECPILGPDHDHQECPECKREREEAEARGESAE